MIRYVRWSRGSGRSRVSAQPGVTCDSLFKCLRYLSKKGGSAFKSELKTYLIKANLGERAVRDTILMLKYFRFVDENDKIGRLQLQQWLVKIGGELSQKENILIALATGILSGGYVPATQTNMGKSEELLGTRLILSGLRDIMAKVPEGGMDTISLDELAQVIDEKGITSIFCIVKLLATPTEKDPYSLGILRTKEKVIIGSFFLRLNQDVLHSYQLSIVSRYLSWVIPELLHKKYAVSFESALVNNLNIVNAESIRQALRAHPPVWISDENLDVLIREATEFCGYEWWAEDRSGGGRGLLDDQRYTYVRITKPPATIALKNPIHGLF